MTVFDDMAAKTLVPDRFEDLRRDTAEDRARFSPAKAARRVARAQGLIGDRAFMQVSGRVSRWATVAGALLILAGLRAPLWAAVRTAPGLVETMRVTSDGVVAALRPMAFDILAKAQALKAGDERGVDLARRGLACLNGTGSCPAGRSPLQ